MKGALLSVQPAAEMLRRLRGNRARQHMSGEARFTDLRNDFNPDAKPCYMNMG